MKSVLVLLALSSSLAIADSTNYSHNVARVNGSLACTIGLDEASFDCTLHVKGTGDLAIDMAPINDKNGKLVGYYGTDQITGDGINHLLAVSADAKQAISAVALINDNRTADETVFTFNVTTFRTGKTHVANISPVNVDITDMSNIKISLNFVVYGDRSEAIVQPNHREDLTKYLIGQIKPYLATLK